MLAALIATLNRASIDQCPHFAAHASVVSGQGRLIAFPADSGGGKTTLAAALVASGFSYVSDEALVLDDTGRALPYPKPLSLSRWSCTRLGLTPNGEETIVTAGDLGGTTAFAPSRVTDLVVASYGSGETVMQQIRPSEAVRLLLENSFNHYKNPGRAFQLATDVARRATVWRLEYDDPTKAAVAIASQLERST